MPSIFTRIIQGELPAHKVAEDDNYLAFLDINPLVKGHVLVIPKIEVDYIFDLSEEQLNGLMNFASKVAKGLEKAVPCKRVAVSVIGLEVPHVHIHLLPIESMDDTNFTRPKLTPSTEELEETANRIKGNI